MQLRPTSFTTNTISVQAKKTVHGIRSLELMQEMKWYTVHNIVLEKKKKGIQQYIPATNNWCAVTATCSGIFRDAHS